ncbi:MAG: DUF3015 family protein [Magnetococcales bacterium]|nr:DUF3015 family protein [Magnetococcales bacterium]
MRYKKMSMVAAAGLSVAMLSSAASAREFAAIYQECGLGALIAPNHPIVAVITNVTWDLGTTAVTSDMVSPDTCKGSQAKMATFIHEGYKQIETAMATGQGEYLTSLMNVSGCAAAVQPELSKALRKDFSSVVSAPGYSEQSKFDQSKGMYDMINKRINSDFSKSCTI